nr:hypothetical protein [Tanacetum cinerariifolium]
MQMLYCFVNNIHVDYAELLWEGFHYSLKNLTTLIPYPRFTKLIVNHYMTAYPEILRRVRARYHNLSNDVMIKSIFNSGKSKVPTTDEADDLILQDTLQVSLAEQKSHEELEASQNVENVKEHLIAKVIEKLVEGKSKGIVGMKIPDWMITDEMKLTENYRSPNPVVAEEESSAPQRSTVIRLRIPPRRSTRLTPPTPVPTTDEADDLILQDTLQKSHEELEATQNVEKVKEHLMAKEIKKLVEGSENVEENVEVSSSPLRNDDNQCNPDTRLEPISENESPKVEKITDISQHVNVIKEEEESTEDDYELKRREKGNHVEEIRNTPSPTRIRSPRTHYNLISLDTKKLQELAKTDTIPSSSTPSSSSLKSKLSNTNRLLSLFKSKPGRFKRYKSFFQELQGRYGYLFEHLLARFMPKRNFNKFAQRLQEIMLDSLPKLVDDRNKGILKTQVPLHVAQGIILER